MYHRSKETSGGHPERLVLTDQVGERRARAVVGRDEEPPGCMREQDPVPEVAEDLHLGDERGAKGRCGNEAASSASSTPAARFGDRKA